MADLPRKMIFSQPAPSPPGASISKPPAKDKGRPALVADLPRKTLLFQPAPSPLVLRRRLNGIIQQLWQKSNNDRTESPDFALAENRPNSCRRNGFRK